MGEGKIFGIGNWVLDIGYWGLGSRGTLGAGSVFLIGIG